MPRVPGEEGKKKEPPAYMGDPNATAMQTVLSPCKVLTTRTHAYLHT